MGKLHNLMELNAGGEGSGCHGDNCGRPPAGGAQRDTSDLARNNSLGLGDDRTKTPAAAYARKMGYIDPRKGEFQLVHSVPLSDAAKKQGMMQLTYETPQREHGGVSDPAIRSVHVSVRPDLGIMHVTESRPSKQGLVKDSKTGEVKVSYRSRQKYDPETGGFGKGRSPRGMRSTRYHGPIDKGWQVLEHRYGIKKPGR